MGVPGLAIATGAGLWMETQRVARAPLPHFEDHDPSGTYGDPSGDGLAITVLGDSTITAPGLESGKDSWIAQLASALPRRTTLRSVARGGTRVRDVLTEQVEPALDTQPDLFVVAVGANDALHATPAHRFRSDLSQVLAELSRQGLVISLGIGDLSVIPRFPATLRPLVRWRCGVLDRMNEKACEAHDRVVRIPVHDIADPSFSLARSELFTEDMFHPNTYGHTLWAALFGPFVANVLDSLAPRCTDPGEVAPPA